MSAAVMAALMAGIFVLGMVWGYVLVLAFSGNLIRPPAPPKPSTDFIRCGDIAVDFHGTPLVCTRLRGHAMPHHDASTDTRWQPVPESWQR